MSYLFLGNSCQFPTQKRARFARCCPSLESQSWFITTVFVIDNTSMGYNDWDLSGRYIICIYLYIPDLSMIDGIYKLTE